MIELMIVVAILGILATLAYPSYRDYIIRGRIPEGLALLGNEQVVAANFLGDNRVYSGIPPGGNTPVSVCNRYSTPVMSKYFTVSCALRTVSGSSGYVLTVAGRNDSSENSMAGFSYTINDNGDKATTGLGAGWTFPPPGTSCYSSGWVLKRDGSC